MKLILLALLCVPLLHGQAFDVASVKRSTAGSQFSFASLTGGKISAHNVDVRDLIRDQLGLKLQRTRSTVEMLTIEHIERPSAS